MKNNAIIKWGIIILFVLISLLGLGTTNTHYSILLSTIAPFAIGLLVGLAFLFIFFIFRIKFEFLKWSSSFFKMRHFNSTIAFFLILIMLNGLLHMLFELIVNDDYHQGGSFFFFFAIGFLLMLVIQDIFLRKNKYR